MRKIIMLLVASFLLTACNPGVIKHLPKGQEKKEPKVVIDPSAEVSMMCSDSGNTGGPWGDIIVYLDNTRSNTGIGFEVFVDGELHETAVLDGGEETWVNYFTNDEANHILVNAADTVVFDRTVNNQCY